MKKHTKMVKVTKTTKNTTKPQVSSFGRFMLGRVPSPTPHMALPPLVGDCRAEVLDPNLCDYSPAWVGGSDVGESPHSSSYSRGRTKSCLFPLFFPSAASNPPEAWSPPPNPTQAATLPSFATANITSSTC